MPADFSTIGPFLLAALVIFATYRRFRRNFGRRPVRRKIRMVLLAIVGAPPAPPVNNHYWPVLICIHARVRSRSYS